MLQKLIKKMLNLFFTITTGTLLSTALFITFLIPNVQFGVEILWQIFLIPLATTPLSLIFCSSRELSKKELLIRRFIHYILLNIVLICCAYAFDWFEANELVKLLFFMLSVLFVYVIANIVYYINEKKEASILTTKLQEYQKRKG